MSLTSSDIARLFDDLAAELVAFFVTRTLAPDISVELLSETFAAAFIAREQFKGKGAGTERAWLYGIARNQLIDYFRRGQVEMRALRRLGAEPRMLTDVEYDRIENAYTAQTLRCALQDHCMGLSPEQREALHLRVVQELSYDEIAHLLGVTKQTVRARVSRALRTLRESSVLADLMEVSDHA